MKHQVTRSLERLRDSFASFTAGQKFVAVLGTAALVLAGVMVFRWASAPSYAPLYSGLAPADASAVVEELTSQGVPYELAAGGTTIMVPQSRVYDTRITLSGQGLPSASDGGYSLLDNQDLSTSQFKEQTDFKRAMEGELARTLRAIDGVESAVVHLAMPPRQVFADEQDPTTASVLLGTRAGATLAPQQVQAVINLVSSSVDGLKPENVSVADASGRVLSAPAGSAGAAASTQTQQVQDFEIRMQSQIQTMLDRVVGPGNATVNVRADLSFDKATTETVRYFGNAETPALSETTAREEYTGPAASAGVGAGGVVGPDGQMDTDGQTGEGGSSYTKRQSTADRAIDRTTEVREAAPGSVRSLHVAVALDERSINGADPGVVENLIASGVGIDDQRGDTVEVSALPFDRSAEEAAAAELAEATKVEERAALMTMIRNGGLAVLIALMVLLAWLKARKSAKRREEATSYMVEQLRKDAAERAALQAAAAHQLEATSPALAALEARDHDLTEEVREEIAALVERQPEDVAALLRGWLVERGA